MSGNERVDVEFDTLVRSTANGWWIAIGEGFDAEEFFLPESLCHMHEDDNYINVPEWLATEKGLT